MNFSVTYRGKPLDPICYTWDENTKTFASHVGNLVLDFSGMDGVTFKTSNNCSFKTGSHCEFDTGSDCAFKTGSHCTFDTGSDCIFDTNTDCKFSVDSGCVFEVGENCSLTYIWDSCFEVHKLEPNKKFILLDDENLKEILGHIQTDNYMICWWKEDNEHMIKVGCQEHSLETWKKNYLEIAEENCFEKDLIPKYLEHLKMIESSL